MLGLQAAIGGAQPLVSTDRSGRVTVGGKSQVLAPANPLRKQLIIENPLTAAEQGLPVAENLYVNVGGQPATLTVGNFANLAPGGSVSFIISRAPPWPGAAGGLIDTSAVTVTAATPGHAWNAKEYV